MESTQLLIALKAISGGMGFLCFYLFDALPKIERKHYMEFTLNQVVHLVLFIWGAKILLNFSTFIESPLAIFAYPSNANIFYIALLLTSILIYLKKDQLSKTLLMYFTTTFTMFMFASFTYELLRFSINNARDGILYIILLGILSVIYVWGQDRCTWKNFRLVIVLLWFISSYILSLRSSFPGVFGYTINNVILFTGILILFIVIFIYRKKVF